MFIANEINVWTSDNVAIYSFIIAVLSFVVSIAAIVVSAKQNIKINTTNLQAIYFEEVYKDFLLYEIPRRVEKLKYTQRGVLEKDYIELIDVLLDMMEKSKYFAYAKHDFYISLKDKCMDLEDELAGLASKSEMDEFEQKKNLYRIHESVQDIFACINDNYHDF